MSTQFSQEIVRRDHIPALALNRLDKNRRNLFRSHTVVLNELLLADKP